LDKLEIVEVAYRGLAAGRGVIWLRVGFWVSMLGIEIKNSLDFLWVFFSTSGTTGTAGGIGCC
jgi:hypothetical protein